MKPPLFEYRAPRTIDEAIGFLASDADAMVLAGGQSLMPAMNFRVANPSMLVDIQHVEGLKGIAIEDGQIVIKAMTRHRELELDANVRRLNPLVCGNDAARRPYPDPQSRHDRRQPVPRRSVRRIAAAVCSP